jgi:hypothetical protein
MQLVNIRERGVEILLGFRKLNGKMQLVNIRGGV